jgi:hypothetical protein
MKRIQKNAIQYSFKKDSLTSLGRAADGFIRRSNYFRITFILILKTFFYKEFKQNGVLSGVLQTWIFAPLSDHVETEREKNSLFSRNEHLCRKRTPLEQ